MLRRALSRPVPVTAVMVAVLLAASVSAAVVGTDDTAVVTAGGGSHDQRVTGHNGRVHSDEGTPDDSTRGSDFSVGAGRARIGSELAAGAPRNAAASPTTSSKPRSAAPAASLPATLPPGTTTTTSAPARHEADVCRARSGGAGTSGSVFSTRDPGLYVIRPDGNGVRRILRSPTDRNFYWVAWSPDSRRVAASDDRDMWVVGADGASSREIAPDLYNVQFPSWSPDGASLAFVGREGAPEGTPRLYVAAADGSGRHRVANAPDAPSLVTWSPDGARIAFTTYGGSVWTIRPDGGDLRKHASGPSPFSLSWRGADQLILAGVTDGSTGVHLVGLDGSRHQLLHRTGEVQTSPDCRQVALADNRLTVIDVDTAQSRELADGQPDGTHFSSPAWSPDARSLVVTSRRTYEGSGRYETDQDLIVVGLDGSARKLVDQDPAWGWLASARGWSPDGGLVAFVVAGY